MGLRTGGIHWSLTGAEQIRELVEDTARYEQYIACEMIKKCWCVRHAFTACMHAHVQPYMGMLTRRNKCFRMRICTRNTSGDILEKQAGREADELRQPIAVAYI